MIRLPANRSFVGAGIVLLLGACGEPRVVVPAALSVTIMPAHGSVDISTDVEPLVYFSHPVKDTTTLGDSILLACMGAPPCSAPDVSGCSGSPAVTVAYDPGGQVARLQPDNGLELDRCYAVVVSGGIEARGKQVQSLPAEVRSSFRTQ